VGDRSIKEGNSGITPLEFPVSLAFPLNRPVQLTYSTHDVAGPNAATAGQDYVPVTNGTLVIPAGQTTATLRVGVIGDTVPEPDESFAIDLTATANATLLTARVFGTILDDDSAPAAAAAGDQGVVKGSDPSAPPQGPIQRAANLPAAQQPPGQGQPGPGSPSAPIQQTSTAAPGQAAPAGQAQSQAQAQLQPMSQVQSQVQPVMLPVGELEKQKQAAPEQAQVQRRAGGQVWMAKGLSHSSGAARLFPLAWALAAIFGISVFRAPVRRAVRPVKSAIPVANPKPRSTPGHRPSAGKRRRRG